MVARVVVGLVVILLSFAGTLFFMDRFVGESVPNIGGTDWCMQPNSRTKGGPTAIVQDGRKLEFRNEFNGKAKGHFENARTVVAEDWGKAKGILSADSKMITWATDTVWTRGKPCAGR